MTIQFGALIDPNWHSCLNPVIAAGLGLVAESDHGIDRMLSGAKSNLSPTGTLVTVLRVSLSFIETTRFF